MPKISPTSPSARTTKADVTRRPSFTNWSAVKTPSTSDHLVSLKDYWADDGNRPYHFPHALALVMAYVAVLETHDSPKIHRLTGFPLLFVSRLVFELSRSTLWQSNFGYLNLVQLMGEEDLEGFNHVIGELLASQDLLCLAAYSELQAEWDRAMGVEVEL